MIDVRRWRSHRIRCVLRHFGGCFVLPAVCAFALHQHEAAKGRPAAPRALLMDGGLMLVLSLAARRRWARSGILTSLPERVSIRDARVGERALVEGRVVAGDQTVTGPASGRRGVSCHIVIEAESRTNQGMQWTPVFTREWNVPFLLDDASGVCLRVHGANINVDPEINKLVIVHESYTGASGLPERARKLVHRNETLREQHRKHLRAVETVIGDGDIMIVVGRLDVRHRGHESPHREGASAERSLLDAEMIQPMSVADLSRWLAHHQGQRLLLTALAATAVILIVAGLFMT
jgi:hypothetical protein